MNKSVKDREKAQQEKHQAILSALLRDEDNKYCADCHAKGPRWASHNLGVFLCIRCAGIHRNLGVHISKVKSVNLDSWTTEQLFMVGEVGNSRAMAVYEANVPDGFRRPQTDSALEIFIRDKYERKRYIAREWIPPKPPSKADTALEERKKEKKTSSSKTSKSSGSVQLNNVSRPKSSTQSSNGSLSGPAHKTTPRPPASVSAPSKPAAASDDLLGLTVESSPVTNAAAAQPATNDLFGDFLSADASATSAPGGEKPSDDLADPALGKPKSTKDSIMALFASGGGNQQQFYGVPGGTYMGPQPTPTSQPQPQQANNFMMNGTHMMPSQPNMMTPQPNLMASQQNMMASPMPGGMMPQQGMMTSQPNMMNSTPGLMTSQQGMMTSQPGMMASQPGLMNSTPGMMTSQQGMMTSQAGMMASQPGMMPSQQGMMPQQNMMASPMPGMGAYQGQQIPNQMGHMNQGMMGMQPGMMGGQMMPQQQQNYNSPHLQQVQHQMASMRLGQQAGTVAAGSGGWGQQPGNTLATNLWH